ncbi:asparagine--tRNA ligase [Thermoflexus sp.]|uniref:asparagine--tRNA ligase n=1 Tax=Thermoflexus sp. TaxID=1969742 RepID=UPI0035E43E17
MTAPIMRIERIAEYVGQEVTIRGWLYNKTDKGRLYFLLVRDGTGIAQCVVSMRDVPPETFEAARRVTQESSLIVTGTVRQDARAPGVPGGYEIGVREIRILHLAQDYPIGPKEHGVEFLLDHRHLWLRSSRQWAIQRIRATVIRAIRDWLDSHGFLNVDTPLLTATAAEGTTTLFPVDYFGERLYLAQTGQLYNEANIFAFGRVYCFGPAFRAERSKTRRHLLEFWMVEPEMAFCTFEEMLEIAEQLVSYVVARVLEERRNELRVLERDTAPLEKVAPPFPRITYDEAVRLLNEWAEEEADPERKAALRIEWGDDFGAPHETALSLRFEKPVFVTHYPAAIKAFYMQPDPQRPEVVRCADLLAPEGYGEIIGGSERIADLDLLLQRIQEHGLPLEEYQWYLDLRRYGSVPHSGFGLGIERTVAWICHLDHIREAIAFPRMLYRYRP